MIRLRASIAQRGRSLLLLSVLGLICFALAWAHGTPAGHEMAERDAPMTDAVAVCLAVLEVVGGLLLVATGTVTLRSGSRIWELETKTRSLPQCYAGPALALWPRAGPALQVFRC